MATKKGVKKAKTTSVRHKTPNKKPAQKKAMPQKSAKKPDSKKTMPTKKSESKKTTRPAVSKAPSKKAPKKSAEPKGMKKPASKKSVAKMVKEKKGGKAAPKPKGTKNASKASSKAAALPSGEDEQDIKTSEHVANQTDEVVVRENDAEKTDEPQIDSKKVIGKTAKASVEGDASYIEENEDKSGSAEDQITEGFDETADDEELEDSKTSASSGSEEKLANKFRTRLIDTYEYKSKNIPITIKILNKNGEYVPIYDLIIASISKHTEYFLEKIRKELVREVNLGIVDLTDIKKKELVEERFSETIVDLINKYFPDIDEETMSFLTTYLIQKSLGLGKIDLLMSDPYLEEIAINSADEPIWVYHKKHAWVKTTIMLENEEQTRHYATMIGRKVGRQLSVLEPLLDASINKGDRVNATLMPISNHGNTITLRKTSAKPWTVTDLIKSNTITAEAAALIWLAMQYELSALICGGTASGKTSMLNAIANLFPPNQRILTIEDTREIMLPKFLHWIPMLTRLPNSEGKGGVLMLDLLVNALRQRPDRILVGEIRRKKEAEVMFEAIHTGHSVYGTFHANTTDDAVTRLTSPPIEIPKTMLPGISMLIIQYRNRRTGLRRTFQIAEICEDGSAKVILQYDPKKDKQIEVAPSSALIGTIKLFTGLDDKEIKESINEKVKVLKYLVKHDINDVDRVGRVVAEYYTNPENLFTYVRRDKLLE